MPGSFYKIETMKRIASFTLMAFAFCCLSFRGDVGGRVDLHTINLIKNEGFNDSKVMGTLFELTDENGPRLTGSTGMKNAEKWAKKKLESWGLGKM